jgi:hypothetical protein
MIKTKIVGGQQFMKEMNNIFDYASGFLEGVKYGKKSFLESLGRLTVEQLKEFVDTNARMNREALMHVYEWGRTGSPDARLFDINYTVSNLGLSLKSNFTQSKSILSGSKEPFRDKAAVMESGKTVTISPKESPVLVFNVAGEKVFTQKSVTVNPGGKETDGSYERYFDTFMTRYFTQAFLKSSGIYDRLKTPVAFKANLPAAKRGGKGLGFNTGYRWISNVVVE